MCGLVLSKLDPVRDIIVLRTLNSNSFEDPDVFISKLDRLNMNGVSSMLVRWSSPNKSN